MRIIRGYLCDHHFSTLTFAKCGLMLRKMLTSTLDVIKLTKKYILINVHHSSIFITIKPYSTCHVITVVVPRVRIIKREHLVSVSTFTEYVTQTFYQQLPSTVNQFLNACYVQWVTSNYACIF